MTEEHEDNLDKRMRVVFDLAALRDVLAGHLMETLGVKKRMARGMDENEDEDTESTKRDEDEDNARPRNG